MSSERLVWRFGRCPTLDGLRGIAVLLVVLHHSSAPYTIFCGQVGVTIFFCLSGFLIADGLLREHAATGTIDLGAFYLRRARRLLPALLVTVTAVLALTWATGIPFTSMRGALSAIFYCSNLLVALGIDPKSGALGHTWTLVIEEQFYLLWPALTLLLVRRPRFLAVLLVAGVLGPLVLRFATWDGGLGRDHVIYGTTTRVDALFAGCLLALVQRQGVGRPDRRTGAVLAVAVGGCLFVASLAEPIVLTAGFSLVAIFTCVAIDAGVRRPHKGWFDSPPLVWLGRRSYGVYLWNFPVVCVAGQLGSAGLSWGERMAVTGLPTVVLAALSWRLVERPVLSRAPRTLATLGAVGTDGTRMAAGVGFRNAPGPGTVDDPAR